jgi:hypothetical protein
MSKGKLMNRKIVMLSALAATLFSQSLGATEHALTTSDIRSFPLPQDRIGIRANYNRINDTIDIFDIKQKELGSTAKFGSIGDSSGLDLSLAYGASEFYSFYYNFERLNLHYIDSTLKNNKNELYAKVNIYQNPMAFFETLSADIGFVRNSASDLDIKDKTQLNKMIEKVNPIPGLTIDGSTIKYKNSAITLLDPVTNKAVSPFVRIGDMADNSLYLRLLTGFHYETNIVDLYSGLKYTSISTRVSLEPEKVIEASAINNTLKNKGYAPVDLDRNEKTFFLGFNYTVEFSSFIFDFNYEYLTIWGRGDDIKKTDDNHIINSALSYIINKNLLVFVGGKLLLHQFNGVIPYLYNKYTKNKYDKKYGYAKVGFVYNFDTENLFNLQPNGYTSGYTSY